MINEVDEFVLSSTKFHLGKKKQNLEKIHNVCPIKSSSLSLRCFFHITNNVGDVASLRFVSSFRQMSTLAKVTTWSKKKIWNPWFWLRSGVNQNVYNLRITRASNSSKLKLRSWEIPAIPSQKRSWEEKRFTQSSYLIGYENSRRRNNGSSPSTRACSIVFSMGTMIIEAWSHTATCYAL